MIIIVDLALCTGYNNNVVRPISPRRANREATQEGPPGPPGGSKPLYPPFWTPQGPRRPQEAPRESSGTIRTHTGPYGSIRIHTDTSQVNFQQIF